MTRSAICLVIPGRKEEETIGPVLREIVRGMTGYRNVRFGGLA
jgi:hypothetical protein